MVEKKEKWSKESSESAWSTPGMGLVHPRNHRKGAGAYAQQLGLQAAWAVRSRERLWSSSLSLKGHQEAAKIILFILFCFLLYLEWQKNRAEGFCCLQTVYQREGDRCLLGLEGGGTVDPPSILQSRQPGPSVRLSHCPDDHLVSPPSLPSRGFPAKPYSARNLELTTFINPWQNFPFARRITLKPEDEFSY